MDRNTKREKIIMGIVTAKLEKDKSISIASYGAVGELLVSADLLEKGYEVYRSVSPNASCDIVIIDNMKTYRVEVKTTTSGDISSYPKNPYDYDIIAIVSANIITYNPPLDLLPKPKVNDEKTQILNIKCSQETHQHLHKMAREYDMDISEITELCVIKNYKNGIRWYREAYEDIQNFHKFCSSL